MYFLAFRAVSRLHLVYSFVVCRNDVFNIWHTTETKF